MAVILAIVTNPYAQGGVGTGPGMPGPDLPRRGRPRKRVAALIVACAVVAGGAFAAAEALSGAPQSPAAGTASTAASGPTGQAAVLNGVLADASSASSAAVGTSTQPTTTTPGAAVRRLRRALVRLRLLGGMHGEFTFPTKDGPRTLAFERGTIVSVTGADATVKATDGTTWTWVLTSTSVVREDGARRPASTLAAGQSVFAGGPVSGSTRDARLIVIRPAAKSQS